MKSIILDFDGVIHNYKTGWHGADIIVDPPVEGAIEHIREYLKHFIVIIFSGRNASDNGIMAMKKYLIDNGLSEKEVALIHFPKDKPAADVGLDDHIITFEGKFPSVKSIKNFKPWHRKK